MEQRRKNHFMEESARVCVAMAIDGRARSYLNFDGDGDSEWSGGGVSGARSVVCVHFKTDLLTLIVPVHTKLKG